MRWIRGIALVLLAFLGISAVTGAVPLILDPSGGLLHMPVSLLTHSPFRSFLLPGWILLLAIGLFSFVVMGIVLRRCAGNATWIIAQGVVLFGWITVQVILIRTVIWAHCLYWGLAIALMVAGSVLCREQNVSPRQTAKLGS